ncbi:hypothetical protein BC938DRAFT_475353, partial [Jimgerdemannia flammicorona]
GGGKVFPPVIEISPERRIRYSITRRAPLAGWHRRWNIKKHAAERSRDMAEHSALRSLLCNQAITDSRCGKMISLHRDHFPIIQEAKGRGVYYMILHRGKGNKI